MIDTGENDRERLSAEKEKFRNLALEEADPVLTLLAELNLGQYYSDVKALGADSLEDLKFIENDDLAFMKPIHRRKFFKQLELM